MVRLLILLAVMAAMVAECSSRGDGKLQSVNVNNVKETPSVAEEIMLIKYENGRGTEVMLPGNNQDTLIEIITSLFRDSEPLRVYIEDEEMQTILENRTGFVLRFNPWLKLQDSNNQLYEVMFLTQGTFSNSSQNHDVVFFIAIDGEDYIRSPFIAHESVNKYLILSKLLDF